MPADDDTPHLLRTSIFLGNNSRPTTIPNASIFGCMHGRATTIKRSRGSFTRRSQTFSRATHLPPAHLVANKRETSQGDVSGGKRLFSTVVPPLHHGSPLTHAVSSGHRFRSYSLPSQTSNKYDDGDRLPTHRS